MEFDQEPAVDTSPSLRIRLVRYLLGDATAQDRLAIERRMAAEPDLATTLRELRSWWHRPADTDRLSDEEVASGRRGKAMIRVKAGIHEKATNKPAQSEIPSGKRIATLGHYFGRLGHSRGGLGGAMLRRTLWSSGAVVAAALACIFLSYKTANHSGVIRTYRTRAGQQATVILNDGTRVTLAPRSTLRLAHFGAFSRTVDLDGQAYFEVTKAEGRPFVVRTGAIATQVLGTAFLVRHYANDGNVHIAVAQGKVGLTSVIPGRRPFSSPVTLTAGYVGDVTDSTVIVNALTDLTRETDWLRGQLVFRNASVSDVLQTLQRWYGFQFRCTDSTIVQKSVTLALDAQSSTVALSTLEQFLRVNMTVVGDTVTLIPYASTVPKGTARQRGYDVWIPTREVGR